MAAAEISRRREVLVVACGAAILFALQALCFHGLRQDDAFITYRYGANLSLGRGVVFNPGERIMGSTSPGQVLLSAAVHAAVGHAVLPSVMATLGCLGWTLQALLVRALLRPSWGARPAALAGLLFGLGLSEAWWWVPLETNLVLASVLAGLWAGSRDRPFLAAILLALAGLLRPDAHLASIVVGLRLWRQRGVGMLPAAAVFLGLSSLWPSFAWSYFGAPLPLSASTKFHRAGLVTYLQHELQHIPRVIVGLDSPFVVAGFWAIALLGASVLWRRGAPLRDLVAWGGLHLAAYAYLRPFTVHTWHLYPGVVVFGLCFLAGAAAIVLRATPSRPIRHTLGWAAVVLLALRMGHAAAHVEMKWTGGRDRVYRSVVSWLVARARPGDKLASVEVGTLAYYSDLPVIDLGGLVTPPAQLVIGSPAGRIQVFGQPPPRFLVRTSADRFLNWSYSGESASFGVAGFLAEVRDFEPQRPQSRPR